MFDKKEEIKEVETIIGPSVKVEGNLVSKGNIIIEGTVSGKIYTTGSVNIGQNAKIFADVEAHTLFVSGEIKGNIIAAERLVLSSSAKINGNIETKQLTIEPGAIFQGKSQMRTVDSQSIPDNQQKSKQIFQIKRKE